MLVDVDDTIIEVHGYAKQGAGFGYSKVRGLNALLATVTTAGAAPVVVAQRLRKGSCGSPRGAKRLVADALRTVQHAARPPAGEAVAARGLRVLWSPTVGAALRGGADVSVTVRMDPKVKAAIATIGDDAWTPIEYTDAVFDEASRYVDLAGRGRRGPLHRVHLRGSSPSRCPGGWWCAGSPT